MSTTITWRVKYNIDNLEVIDNFTSNKDAEEYYSFALKDLKNLNDRVILYRIKVYNWGSRYDGGPDSISTYQDVYKCDILGPAGVIHIRNKAPSTWQRAELYRKQARLYRKKVTSRKKG